MKLYLLSQDYIRGFDTYDSILVCAESEEEAKTITPTGDVFIEGYEAGLRYGGWANNASQIRCEEIGTANANQKRGVIIASFNTG